MLLMMMMMMMGILFSMWLLLDALQEVRQQCSGL
jgi:hypothetical protein